MFFLPGIRYGYMSTWQLLGLEEGPATANKEDAVTRGAYLSFLLLRHLRLRELKVKKKLCVDQSYLVFMMRGLSFNWKHNCVFVLVCFRECAWESWTTSDLWREALLSVPQASTSRLVIWFSAQKIPPGSVLQKEAPVLLEACTLSPTFTTHQLTTRWGTT